ncbi:MAG TPA: glutathione transferase [Byssovorax sp.]|jgi:glutathione S-transferase
MSDLELFVDSFWISPYAFTAFVALTEKGLAFDVRPVALNTHEQDAPAFRDATVTGRVPALRHGDFWLAESAAIVDYLDDAFPDAPRALPNDVKDRARARQLLGWIRSDLGALREERSTATMFYGKATAPLTKAGEAAAAKLARVAEAVVPADRDALFGGGFCVADADLAFMLHRLILNGHEVPARVRAFADRVWQRPSVRAFVAHERIPFEPY